jgi:SAM-dependent methyltransferase
LHPDARTIFDIGFGFAQALLYFKDKGFDVSGIEPSTEGVQYAKEHGLSNVYGAGIEDFDVVGTNRYDVVMLLNVLEHLRYPAETIKEIKNKLMTKDGLLIIEVPNEFNDFQMVANDEYNLNDWWICPPNHINYFSASSLENLLEKSGFTIVKKEASFPLELFMLMGDVYVGNDNLGKECHNKRVLFESLMRKHNKSDKLADFYSRLAELDLGRQIILYARPTN